MGRLAVGTYYLHEIKAPNGYFAPAEDLRMTVAPDGSVVLYAQTSNTSSEFTSEGDVCTVMVKNSHGFALPSTGGAGTIHYYFFGIMFISLAGVGLMMKRKRQNM